jgi:hypothetical protein
MLTYKLKVLDIIDSLHWGVAQWNFDLSLHLKKFNGFFHSPVDVCFVVRFLLAVTRF